MVTVMKRTLDIGTTGSKTWVLFDSRPDELVSETLP